MQPDNAILAASSPKVTLSDDMGTLPIESLAFAASLMRQKRDDSIKRIIRKNRRLCQHLRTPPALRKRGCGFYAASFASSA
jgi:hypothetical protein